jgi:hypothetical protein
VNAPNRKGMGLGDALLVWLASGFIVVFGGGTYAAAHLGSWMAGIDAPPPIRVKLRVDSDSMTARSFELGR